MAKRGGAAGLGCVVDATGSASGGQVVRAGRAAGPAEGADGADVSTTGANDADKRSEGAGGVDAATGAATRAARAARCGGGGPSRAAPVRRTVKPGRVVPARGRQGRWAAGAEATFLAELAASANVTRAAAAAGLASSSLYRHRRADPAFDAAWADALAHGYRLLEARLLATALAVEGAVEGAVAGAADGAADGLPVPVAAERMGPEAVRIGLSLLTQHRASMAAEAERRASVGAILDRRAARRALLTRIAALQAKVTAQAAAAGESGEGGENGEGGGGGAGT